MSTPAATLPPAHDTGHTQAGAWMVLASALVWSSGGLLARLADVANPWHAVFWRSGTAALFLLCFMLMRDGRAGTVALFRSMGASGLAVALCFATATSSFLVALDFTTVANVLLMQAGVPLLAAMISWVLFREHLRPTTWAAIAAVIGGVAVMVSDSLTGKVSPVGDGLALLIALAFAIATVITRRRADIRMTPAVCTGAFIGFLVASAMSLATTGSVTVETWQLPILFVFGIAMGLGMALFTQGARLIPAAFAALLGTAETILGPLWVWIFMGETPRPRTIVGGGIVLMALVAYLALQMHESRRLRRLPPTVN
jgi:drug/metabolite transporter (DMT)-like permease